MRQPSLKKVTLFLTLLAAAAILPATAQDDSLGTPRWDAPRVMGQASFQNGCRWATVHVMARYGRWGRPSFGVFSYADEDEAGAVRFYHAKIDSVQIESNTAMLSGRISNTNVEEWERLGVQVWIVDSFKPEGQDDEIGAMFFEWPGQVPYPYPPMFTPVLKGDLEVMH